MAKIIQFNKSKSISGITGYPPSPATKAIPEWYRKLPKFVNGEQKFNGKGEAAFTIKACPPFLDSLMSGYMIYTEFDIIVSWEAGLPYLQWRSGGELISTHGISQVAPEQIPEGFSEQPLKFNSLWQIVTPKGYSTMFTHPINRMDLPFYTISGVVETDTYKSVINFPFLMRKSFSGVIPAGTPIAQLHPFKREGWKMEIGVASEKEMADSETLLGHKVFNSYKTQWWQRKEYR